jgi:glutamine synthetase
MFLQEGPHGTAILYIPSVFISYNGEALDEKTVLLRSSEVLAKATIDLLDLLGPVDDGMTFLYHLTWLLTYQFGYLLSQMNLASSTFIPLLELNRNTF